LAPTFRFLRITRYNTTVVFHLTVDRCHYMSSSTQDLDVGVLLTYCPSTYVLSEHVFLSSRDLYRRG